jgi:hypothetical protein
MPASPEVLTDFRHLRSLSVTPRVAGQQKATSSRPAWINRPSRPEGWPCHKITFQSWPLEGWIVFDANAVPSNARPWGNKSCSEAPMSPIVIGGWKITTGAES